MELKKQIYHISLLIQLKFIIWMFIHVNVNDVYEIYSYSRTAEFLKSFRLH